MTRLIIFVSSNNRVERKEGIERARYWLLSPSILVCLYIEFDSNPRGHKQIA
jgi:hypothetical protein